MKGDRLYQWNIDRRSSKEISEADARFEQQKQKELKEVDRLISLVIEEAPSLDGLKKIVKGLNVYLSHLSNEWGQNYD